jgi:hypothetical protein
MIYITIELKKSNIIHANKVAVRCDINSEDVEKIAKEIFKDICESDRINPTYYEYKIYVRINKEYYLLTKEN